MENYFKDYFKACKTIDAIKTEYKKLVKRYHPDIAGNQFTAIMQEINIQYDMEIDNVINTDFKENSKNSKKARKEEANIFKDIISKIIDLENIEIEICNWFLWVSGDTKQHKDILKELNFKWASGKKEWYYKPGWYMCKNRREWSKDKIRSTYGSTKIKKDRDNNSNANTNKIPVLTV